MSRIRIHTRSFHPGETFGSSGLGFSGDNRGFSLGRSQAVTSRIRHFMDIDLIGARVIGYQPVSDPSHHEGMGTTQNYTDPDKQPSATVTGNVSAYREDGDQSFDVTVSYEGKNYAFPGADWEKKTTIGDYEVSISPKHGIRRSVPDLDVTNRISGHIDRTDRWLHIVSDLRGDGFPNCETFAVTGAKTLALCTHVRVGVATTQLFGNRRIPMGYVMLEAQIDGSDRLASTVKCEASLDYAGDGSPLDLRSLLPSATLTRDEWNAFHTTTRDALGPESRREMDNSIWSGLKERFGW